MRSVRGRCNQYSGGNLDGLLAWGAHGVFGIGASCLGVVVADIRVSPLSDRDDVR